MSTESSFAVRSMHRPSVGRIVHRKTANGCEAALITYVWPDGSVNLVAFTMYGDARPHLRLPEGEQDGAWHWPERATTELKPADAPERVR